MQAPHRMAEHRYGHNGAQILRGCRLQVLSVATGPHQ